jgi:hypothetical protein
MRTVGTGSSPFNYDLETQNLVDKIVIKKLIVIDN